MKQWVNEAMDPGASLTNSRAWRGVRLGCLLAAAVTLSTPVFAQEEGGANAGAGAAADGSASGTAPEGAGADTGAASAGDIQGLIDDIGGRISTLGQSNLDSDAALELLSEKVEEAIRKLTSREAENESLRGTASGLQTELQVLGESQESLQTDLQILRQDSQATVSQLETRIAALAEQLSLEEQSGAELDAQIGRLNAGLADTLAARDAALSQRDAARLAQERSAEKVSDQLVLLSNLRQETDALEREKQRLEGQVAQLGSLVDDGKALLADEQLQTAALQTALDASQLDLANERGRAVDLAETLRASRTDLLRERGRSLELSNKLDDTLARLAATQDAADGFAGDLAQTAERAERQSLLLASLKADLAASTDELVAERESSTKAGERMVLLNQQLEELRRQLLSLNVVLDAAETRNDEQQAQIVDLGSRLNQALATRVQELASYRSEFFGRLRQVLGDRADVRVVGDRFVFQSEVLFESGKAELGDEGKTQLLRLANTLSDIGETIPDDLDWVLRVDGHTDERPISTPEFPSNWELSTARALSVVKFMIDSGIGPNRLVAAGFGRYHPIDPRHDEIGFRRNRRIEFKLTQR